MDSEQKKLRLGVHIIISTPGRLVALIKKGDISLRETQTVILDEADVLFSDVTFPLQPLGQACPSSTQFVFVTATLPDIVTGQIQREFPEAVYLSGPGLHRISPTIEEVLVDCSVSPQSQGDATPSNAVFARKCAALLRVLDETRAAHTLVFCNSIAQCRHVENVLRRTSRSRVVCALHSAMNDRAEQLNRFVSASDGAQSAVLVCTDRASRGLDFARTPVSP
jgi:ATP-dependent RNA helicase DDX18/HAS1